VKSIQAELGEAMVALADDLVADFDVIEILTTLTGRCVSILGASAAGLMLAGPDGVLRVIASSSEQMRLLELFELQNEQGPCLESFQTGEVVSHHDLEGATDRWPLFAAEALSSGFGSVYALPLRLRHHVIGALNLFQSTGETFEADSLRAARAFADIATIAILQYRASLRSTELADQVNSAWHTRVTIEQAKGIIAERQHLDMEGAFAALRHHARENDVNLSDVAAAIVAGTLQPSALTTPETRGPRNAD